MSCPECDHILSRRTLSGIEVDYCSFCKGLWFDQGELLALGDAVNFDISQLPAQILRTGRVPRNKKRSCPVCLDQAMKSRTFKTADIDICPTCRGIWLDSGEIQAIFRAYRGDSDRPWFNPSGDWVDEIGDAVKGFYTRLF